MKRINILILFPMVVCSLASCGNNLKHTRVENVDEYVLDIFSKDERIKLSNTKRNFDFFNDRTIPYLSIEEYVDTYTNYIARDTTGQKIMSKYVVCTYDKVATVINSHNNSRCVIDYNKQTATFDSYSGFLTRALDSSGPGDYISTMFDDYYFLEKTYEQQKGNEVVVNFADYHIDSYFFEGKVYLPVHFMTALLETSSPFGYGGIYYNGHRSYMLGGTLELMLNYFDKDYQLFLQHIRKDDTTMNKDYVDFNYNVLAFILDFHYGISKRELRSTGETFYYNKNGGFETLKPYKDGLTSTELGVFDDTFIELFGKELNDGGHSRPAPISITQDKEEPSAPHVGESKYTLDCNDALTKKRLEVLGMDLQTKEGLERSYEEMEYDDNGNKTKIAYITFDNFSMEPFEPKVEGAPYYTHTFNLIHYANEQIRKNNVKNVVIDLACNTGGVILTEEMIESWVCGESHSIEYNKNDKSITKVSRKADINYDQKIDEQDFLPDDVNVYCIISPSSFSCGNLLPCRLKEFSNTKFIGSRSGGGCCSVENSVCLPNGAFLTISSCFSALMKDSTQDNVITVDDGVVADFLKIEDGPEHYAEFFDRDAINRKIVESQKQN